jgi:hypothetical protein
VNIYSGDIMKKHNFKRLALVASVAGAIVSCGGKQDTPATTAPTIQLLSSKAEYVTGGDTLVDVTLPGGSSTDASIRVMVNGTDASSVFTTDPAKPGHIVGLVTGLKVGANTLVASFRGASSTLEITNYPSTGPVFSGPQMTPFICQTQDFALPDGSKLGASTDANCSASTKVNYLYRSTAGGALKPLPATTALPADVAMTTTTSGASVPFIVRIETGTMNRGIYQNAILHDPTSDAAPSPLTPPKGWNKRLIAVHGTGCTGGWYIQGSALGVSTYTGDNLTRLGEGYAVFNNTLNHPTNSCNAVLAGETALMGKEHFIKTFGVPAFTVSTGTSGGAYTSLQTADTFPGLFDGIFISATFPDALSIAESSLDDRLLSRYYLAGNSANFTEAQMVAITGHKSARAWYDLALQSGRADPVPNRIDPIPASTLPLLGGASYRSAVWPAAVPVALRYDPVTNRTGARPTVFDVARNVYGIDKTTGFALRPYDNIGVQYGLKALNALAITPAQFLDLNEKVGGYDQDANYVPARSAGDAGAIKRAYQSGLNMNGNGGLASIPVFDISAIFDEANFYHYQVFHFTARERIAQSNGGDTRNHVMWRGGGSILSAVGAGTPEELALNQAAASQGWQMFIQWMVAYKADTSSASVRDKVIARKPAGAVDGCFTKSVTPQFIAEAQTLSSQPNSQCNALWPSYTLPRIEAGGPVASNILKCQLKPIDAKDYAVTFSADELVRLKALFPNGVCDFAKPGINQTGTTTYPSFGPSGVNLVFDVTKQ